MSIPVAVVLAPFPLLPCQCWSWLSGAAVGWLRVGMRANVLLAFLRLFIRPPAQMLLPLSRTAGPCFFQSRDARHSSAWLSSVWGFARFHQITVKRTAKRLRGSLARTRTHAGPICTEAAFRLCLCLDCQKGLNCKHSLIYFKLFCTCALFRPSQNWLSNPTRLTTPEQTPSSSTSHKRTVIQLIVWVFCMYSAL